MDLYVQLLEYKYVFFTKVNKDYTQSLNYPKLLMTAPIQRCPWPTPNGAIPGLTAPRCQTAVDRFTAK